MVSASITVPKRCAMRITVFFSSFKCRTIFLIRFSDSESKEDVASSKIKTSGSR